MTGPEMRRALYSRRARGILQDYRAEDHMHRLMQNAPARSGLDQAQYADMKMWLPGDILTKLDRTSMAVGLEAREPLLDHRLMEFAASLPENMRVRRGQGKYLMKHTMERYLPKDILLLHAHSNDKHHRHKHSNRAQKCLCPQSSLLLYHKAFQKEQRLYRTLHFVNIAGPVVRLLSSEQKHLI